MPVRRFARGLLAILSTLVLAAPLWVALAYWSSGPLGAYYGWSGHPSIPGAPTWVYVTLFAVVLPILSLAMASTVVWAVARWLAKRRQASRPGRDGAMPADAPIEGPSR